MCSTTDLIKEKKGSANPKTDCLKISSERNKKKKKNERKKVKKT